MSQNARIHIRPGTAAQWATYDPVLGVGEMGIETDTLIIRVGDGATNFTDLPIIARPLGTMAVQDKDAVDITGGTIDLLNNQKIRLGTAYDLQLFSTGAGSFIAELGGGAMHFDTNGPSIVFRKDAGGGIFETMLSLAVDGAVTLYFNNAVKVATTNTGAAVTGELAVSGALKAPSLILNEKTMTAGWEPYNGTDGIFYNFAVNGGVATVDTPNWGDGFDYKVIGERLSSAAVAQPFIKAYRATDAAFGAAVNFHSAGAQAASTLWTWEHQFDLPRMTKSQHGFTGQSFNGSFGANVDGPQIDQKFVGFIHAVPQKLLKAQYGFTAGNIDAGVLRLLRRASNP